MLPLSRGFRCQLLITLPSFNYFSWKFPCWLFDRSWKFLQSFSQNISSISTIKSREKMSVSSNLFLETSRRSEQGTEIYVLLTPFCNLHEKPFKSVQGIKSLGGGEENFQFSETHRFWSWHLKSSLCTGHTSVWARAGLSWALQLWVAEPTWIESRVEVC